MDLKLNHRILIIITLLSILITSSLYVFYIAPDPVEYCEQFELSDYQLVNDIADNLDKTADVVRDIHSMRKTQLRRRP